MTQKYLHQHKMNGIGQGLDQGRLNEQKLDH